MKQIIFHICLLMTVVLQACTTATAPAPSETPQPTLALPSAPASTETITPTSTPEISLPVDRFQALPELSPITSENISDLQPVATYSESQLIEVNVSETQDRALVVYSTGVQVYDLPDLTPRPFLPVDLTGLGNGPTHLLSPTGKYLAVVTRELANQIQIWDLDTQQRSCAIKLPGEIDSGGRGPLIMMFFPETNRFLFNGLWLNRDKTQITKEIKLLNLTDCSDVFSVQDNDNKWWLSSFSPDGRKIAYLEDQQVVVLNVDDKSVSTFGDSVNVRGVGFMADSQSVIISYSNNTRIIDLASGEVTHQLDSNQGREYVYIYPLHGNRILLAQNEANRIWDIATNNSFQLGPEFITSHRSFFDDRNGALVTWESVWNLDKKNRVVLTKYPHGRELSALSSESSFLAVDSGYAPYQTDLLDTATSRLILSLPGERAPVAVDGDTFVTSGDGQIFVHDFSSGEVLDTLQGEYMNGKTLADGQVLLWDAKGNISILDVEQGSILLRAALPIFPLDYGRIPDLYYQQHNFPAWEKGLGFDLSSWLASSGRNTAVVSPDGTTGIRQSGDVVQIFSIKNDALFPTSETLLASYPFKGLWLQFRFSADGKMIVGITHSQLIVWDSQTGRQIRGVFGKKYLQGRPTNFGFSPDGSMVLISSILDDSRTLNILDLKTGELLQSQDASNCNLNLPYVFTPDGSQIFTVTPDCSVGLYNLSDWHEVKSFGGPYSGAELALALSPDGKLLATGQKQSLEIWNVSTGKLIKSVTDLDTHIEDWIGNFALTFSPDGKLLAVRYGLFFQLESTVSIFGVPVQP